ncbi:GDP-mannose 4,6-dehydratase [Exiguobacterium mexicanum]|uniref:GDP-mannose 4,6-dehydratase n=1 Tax=Exiguobacterium mexicanum TaxID=340146 RepID=UPI0037BFBDD9
MVDQPVLIVGVASFKGFHLARRLLQEGFDVVGIDDEGRHKTRIAKQRLYVLTHPQFQLIRTTLANKTVMRSILKRHEPRHIILCSTRTVDNPIERYELMKRYIALHTKHVPLESFITLDLPMQEGSEESPVIHLFTEDVFGSLGRCLDARVESDCRRRPRCPSIRLLRDGHHQRLLY